MKLFARIFFFLTTTLLVACMWTACTARRVPPGKKMIKKVIVVCANDSLEKSDMYGYVKQKPNRKLLGLNLNRPLRYEWIVKTDTADSTKTSRRLRLRAERDYYKTGSGIPLYLMIHNLVNPEREAKRKARKEKKDETKPKKNGEPRKTIGDILYNIGEPPVILDTNLMHRSSQQLEIYLDNKGYFRSDVEDSIAYPSLFKHHLLRKRPDSLNIWGNPKKKVIVYYKVKPAHLYTIDSVFWEVQDPNMAYDVFSDTGAAVLIRRGQPYDLDNFEAERDRIVTSLRNNGYYTFTRDFVRFKADTSVGDYKVNVKIKVLMRQEKVNDTTFRFVSHKRYFIRNVTVKTIYKTEQLKEDDTKYDTVVVDNVTFLRNTEREPELRFKPAVIMERLSFKHGNLYKQQEFDDAYSQLTGLRVFRQVVIEPKEVFGQDQLDVQVLLFAIPKQNFTAQVEGTNTGGYLGIGGSYAYQNNNLARGAELFEFKVKGGTEAQQPLAQTAQVNATDQLTFNTIEVGAEISLNIPRAYGPFKQLPLNFKNNPRRTAISPRTTFSMSGNYQRRVDFDRLLLNFSVGYTYRIGKWQRIGIYPFELNVVKVNPRQGLLDLLANGDVLLQYRFTDHLINDLRFTFQHNETGNPEKTQQKKWRPFFKFDAEMSGFGTYQIMNAIGADKDTFGSYRIGGIPFSHYLRFYVDMRGYKDIGDHQQVIVRLAIGTGFPQKNFRTLPLEKSFFGGGANGIRAWEARSLGPGSLNVPAEQQYAQFGEVQIEYNVELRFRLTKSLFGALFVDGGNIWLLPSANSNDAAEFGFKDFYLDFAFGPGVGLRYDLSFFIVRLDWGFKFRDPSKESGERWWQPGDGPVPSNLNFGIGYPF